MMHPATSDDNNKHDTNSKSSCSSSRTKPNQLVSANARGRRASNCDVLLLYLLLAATVVTLLSIFGPTWYIVQSQAAQYSSSSSSSHGPPQKNIQLDELAHEDEFLKTIKSCLPLEHPKGECGQYVPEPQQDNNSNNKKVQRVAVISPPGDVSDALGQHVDALAQRHNRRVRQNNNTNTNNNPKKWEMQVIRTTHLPPYGYGKTHGLTKIVRLIPQPLLLQVTNALTSVLEPDETFRVVTLNDLTAALRMILRHHCRLSHVAAHTALQSVPGLELWRDPVATLTSLRQFLTPEDDDNNNNNDAEGDDDINPAVLDDDQIEMLEGQMAYGTQLLTHVQATSSPQQNILTVLDRVLMQELEATHHFSKWPCPSFWAAASGPPTDASSNTENTTPTTLSPLLQRLARAMSPDCDDPYNTCFVQRDQCEFQGHADCPGSKKQRRHPNNNNQNHNEPHQDEK